HPPAAYPRSEAGCLHPHHLIGAGPSRPYRCIAGGIARGYPRPARVWSGLDTGWRRPPHPRSRGGSMNHRIGAVAGIAFIVLSFASLTLAPPPPGLDASAAEVVDFFADNTGGLQAMGLLFAVSIAAATVWFGAVRAHVWADGHDAPWGPVATVGMA